MSLHYYRVSLQVSAQDPPFCALIMAAMRKADSETLDLLRACWPDIYDELIARYHAPYPCVGGRLIGEHEVEF